MKTNSPRPRRSTFLAIGGLLLTVSGSVWAQDDVVQGAPVLVSTTGGGDVPWESVEELAAAAQAGDPKANFIYAQHLEFGDQVDADPAGALEHYRRAAAADYPEAAFQLGKIYHDGLLGVREDQAEGLRLYRRAARLGSPEATYNVGAMLASGRGARRDYVEGLAWLMLAADRGSDPSNAVGQLRERLRRRPAMIEAAEKRYRELATELGKVASVQQPSTTGATTLVPAPVPMTPAPMMAPKFEPAKVQVAPASPALSPIGGRPSIGIPSISIPAPPPPKPDPNADEETGSQKSG